jgi:cell division protein FtsB
MKKFRNALAFFCDSGYNDKGGSGRSSTFLVSQFIQQHSFSELAKRHKGALFVAGIVLTLGWAAVSGSQGIDSMLEKREQIRQLQEQNAQLEAENLKRQERIHRLESNSSEQDLEIRRLNLLKQGETTFMLPEAEKKSRQKTKPSR